jgi:hypothetical protein
MKPSDSGKRMKIFENRQFSKKYQTESSNDSNLTQPGKINQYSGCTLGGRTVFDDGEIR